MKTRKVPLNLRAVGPGLPMAIDELCEWSEHARATYAQTLERSWLSACLERADPVSCHSQGIIDEPLHFRLVCGKRVFRRRAGHIGQHHPCRWLHPYRYDYRARWAPGAAYGDSAFWVAFRDLSDEQKDRMLGLNLFGVAPRRVRFPVQRTVRTNGLRSTRYTDEVLRDHVALPVLTAFLLARLVWPTPGACVEGFGNSAVAIHQDALFASERAAQTVGTSGWAADSDGGLCYGPYKVAWPGET